MNNVNDIIQIIFEDHGKGSQIWTIENSVVVKCQPEQVEFWKGCKILHAETGERLQVERQGVKMEVKNPVETIDYLISVVTEKHMH